MKDFAVFTTSDSGAQIASERAQALMKLGNYADALELLSRMASAQLTVDECLLQAICLIHLERPQEALWVCDRALALDDQHPQAWLFRGVALHRLGRFGEAYRCYDLATHRDPATRPVSLRQRCQRWGRPWQKLVGIKRLKHRRRPPLTHRLN